MGSSHSQQILVKENLSVIKCHHGGHFPFLSVDVQEVAEFQRESIFQGAATKRQMVIVFIPM